MFQYCFKHRAPSYHANHCVPVSQVPSRQRLFRSCVCRNKFGSRAFLSPDQQSGVHCQMVCMIQLLTLNILTNLQNTFIHWTLQSIGAVWVALYKLTCDCLLTILSGLVLNALAFRPRGPWFASRPAAMPLFYCAATLGKLFTHIASPVFSAPRNWRTKFSIRTGPILTTDRVR